MAQADLAALEGAALPVDSLREALPHLRRPFTPEAIKFKVQTVFRENTGCIVVAYIDARLVIERLNAVVGEAWQPEYRATSNEKLLMCDLTVCGVTRPDVGQSAKGLSKDLVSDALKRSGVLFGIGVSVYALPQITLFRSQETKEPQIELRGRDAKATLALTAYGHTKLREGYARWLEEHGARLFGPALDHGDVEGDTVDEEQEADEFVPPAPVALDDERATELRKTATDLYALIQAVPGAMQSYPPGTFQAQLQASSHSHEALEQLVAYLGTRYERLVPKGGEES